MSFICGSCHNVTWAPVIRIVTDTRSFLANSDNSKPEKHADAKETDGKASEERCYHRTETRREKNFCLKCAVSLFPYNPEVMRRAEAKKRASELEALREMQATMLAAAKRPSETSVISQGWAEIDRRGWKVRPPTKS